MKLFWDGAFTGHQRMVSLVFLSSATKGLAHMVTVVSSRCRNEEIRVVGASSAVAGHVEAEKEGKVVLATSDVGSNDMGRAWNNINSFKCLGKLDFLIIFAGFVKGVVQHFAKGCKELVTCG